MNSPNPAQKISPASSFRPLLLHSEHFFDLFDGRRVFRRFVFPNEADQSREAQCETDSSLILCASVDWRAGDLIVNYFVLPGDGVTVRAGMYGYPSLAPAQVLDAAGNPAGEWIEFPILAP